MSQRLMDKTKWLWCFLVLYTGPAWSPVTSVSARNPPGPATVEAQAKFFQDFFSVQLSPYKIEFGHVCEDPNTWEQRYEKKDYKNHRDMGKVRWGDKLGGYGEHYWDLNHAGHAGDHGNNEYDGDDGAYNHNHDHSQHRNHDSYEEPSEQSPSYDTEEYDSEKTLSYDENGRAKRAQPRLKSHKKTEKVEEFYEEQPHTKPIVHSRRTKEQLQPEPSDNIDSHVDEEDDEEVTKPPLKKKRIHRKPQKDDDNTEVYQQLKKQTNQFPKQNENLPDNRDQTNTKQVPGTDVPGTEGDNQFVPYEQGSGIRKHHQPEVTTAASVPRLFLEPATGHVVDRATGQAYVLQPVISSSNHN